MIAAKYRHLPALPRNERLPRPRLRVLQNRKLRRLVRHAYRHVPFHRERFRAAGIRPEDIRTVKDLPKIPVMDKHDIRGADPASLLDERIKDKRSLLPVTSRVAGNGTRAAG